MLLTIPPHPIPIVACAPPPNCIIPKCHDDTVYAQKYNEHPPPPPPGDGSSEPIIIPLFGAEAARDDNIRQIGRGACDKV